MRVAEGYWSLERCRYCKGSALLGSVGKYVILCEYCDARGTVLVERATLDPEEEDDEVLGGPQ